MVLVVAGNWLGSIDKFLDEHWKQQIQSCANIPIEPVFDTAEWTFNNDLKTVRVPLRRRMSVMSASSSSSPSRDVDMQKETLYHGTRAGLLCLIVRDGLRSSTRSRGITGLLQHVVATRPFAVVQNKMKKNQWEACAEEAACVFHMACSDA